MIFPLALIVAGALLLVWIIAGLVARLNEVVATNDALIRHIYAMEQERRRDERMAHWRYECSEN